jgi:hypothetical protein
MSKGENNEKNIDNDESAIPSEVWARLEYEMANARWENATNLRRNGLAFFTTVQGAILSIIGDRITNLKISSYALISFGIIVTLFSWSHELRIASYMKGYQNRMIRIERLFNLDLLRSGQDQAVKMKTISNRKLFSWYYRINLIGWLLIILYNIFF